MAKAIKKIIKLHIKAGEATPAPPVGPALAQHGVNIGEFCQKFNALTKEKQGSKIPTEVFVYGDRTYDIVLHEPPASELLRKIAKIEKGSGQPNKKKVATITQEQLQEVAQQKMPDLNTTDIAQAMKTVGGTAKSMGIEVK
ncbi:MAG: 50S ribosomal protein L11 [bacterium]|nr:50S ribosomal protein L11 [bacterium]